MLTITYISENTIVHEQNPALIPKLLQAKTPFWVDMETPTPEEFALLPNVFHFHPLAIEDAQSDKQRQKVDEYGDYAFFALNSVSFSPEVLQRIRTEKIDSGDQALTLKQATIFLGETYLVTIHIKPIEHIQQLRGLCKTNARILRRGVGAVLHTLFDIIVDDCFPILDLLEDELDTLEDNIISKPKDVYLDEIFFLKREFSRLRRNVAPLRDVLQVLMTREFPGITPELLPYLRDVDDHVFRIYELLDTHRDVASNLLDAYLSQKSNELNIVMRKLAAISIVFLPLTFLTGFFGMNFEKMPWSHTNPLFWFGGMIAIGIIIYYSLRKRKWV